MHDIGDKTKKLGERSAKDLEKEGAFLLAAQKYYDEDDLVNSAKMYRRAGHGHQALGILENGGFFIEASEMAEDMGMMHTAARFAEMAGDFERALEIYREVNAVRDIQRLTKSMSKASVMKHAMSFAPGMLGMTFLFVSLFFLTSNITGGAIFNVPSKELVPIGFLLFVFGLLGIFIWVKEKK